MRLVSFITLVLFFIGCSEKSPVFSAESGKQKTILIQPFEDVGNEQVKNIAENIRKIYPHIEILKPIPFPENSYYKPRNRYRADTIIKYLQKNTEAGDVTLALTNKDISVTKGKNADFGVMGLGYKPGRACVASSFRLNKRKKDKQFYKVAIHELGHTQGLNHCPEKTCLMRDAEGGNPTDEEKDFCQKCKTFLKTKNWNLN